MFYKYNNYNFNVIFNSDNFIIQIKDNELLYNNTFYFEELKIENNFLKYLNINNLLVNCFEKKEYYNLEIKHLETIKLIFCYLSDLTEIELELDILPVPKKLTNDEEIIELKNKICNLEDKLIENIKLNKKIYELESSIKNYDYNYNNFIFDNNLTIRYIKVDIS